MKKKNKLYFYKKVIKIPIYFGNFIIIFSNDLEKINKVVNVHYDEDSYVYAATYHNFLYNKYESFAVCFNFWGDTPITLGTIVHELTHVGNRIFKARDFYPAFDNDEAMAYLNGYLADEIQSFMIKCNLNLGY